MAYKPNPATGALLDRAWGYVNSVPYTVTARWLFYRLLQDSFLEAKADYKRLLGYLSKARKMFYRRWRPDTLADDTRAALVRGGSFTKPQDWLQAVKEQVTCNLDRWQSQPYYVEVWFEAAAMQAQFEFYTDPNIPLLAFHGDVSIPEKWKSATRLFNRWEQLKKPIRVLYYGDYDEKGLQIPESAREDIVYFIAYMFVGKYHEDSYLDHFKEFLQNWKFIRVGLNEEHAEQYDIPENPDRPGTYQWEALGDEAAQELIQQANEYMDQDAVAGIKMREDKATTAFVAHLGPLDLTE